MRLRDGHHWREAIHRVVTKIPAERHPGDNLLRRGNMLEASDLTTGQITRVVKGTGAETVIDGIHPDTGGPTTGTPIPDWEALTAVAAAAARLLPGIRTQSWDIALTDVGPMPLEVNFGDDLNVAKLASGAGVLHADYREHLRRCGYRL